MLVHISNIMLTEWFLFLPAWLPSMPAPIMDIVMVLAAVYLTLTYISYLSESVFFLRGFRYFHQNWSSTDDED